MIKTKIIAHYKKGNRTRVRHNTKLSDFDVYNIRKEFSKGIYIKVLSIDYKVSYGHIYAIIKGKRRVL
jgi:hypothetical protein